MTQSFTTFNFNLQILLSYLKNEKQATALFTKIRLCTSDQNKNLTSHFIGGALSLRRQCGITKSCLHSSSVHILWVSLLHWLPPQLRTHLTPLSKVGSDQRVSVRVTVNIEPVRSFTNTQCDGTAWSSWHETVIKGFGVNKRFTMGQYSNWTNTTNWYQVFSLAKLLQQNNCSTTNF